MVKAEDAARYLISLDDEKKYFTKNLIVLNRRNFYDGNARLNKILHLANNIYIAKTGQPLIEDAFYAYDNGGVLPDIQESYAYLLGTNNKAEFFVDSEEKVFLKKVFNMLKDAPLEDLIEIDHEDPAWQEKHNFYFKDDQIMDSMKYVDDYKDRYEAAVFYLDRMEA